MLDTKKLDKTKLSPMMKRYFEIKENYQDCIILFRLGDFYEMFFDDALVASKALDITLTGRDCGQSERAPMCGVPYHAVDNYIKKLIDNNLRVAICEQLSDPATTKGMVERDVVRVISSGTIMEETMLDDTKSNYIASIFDAKKGFGLAWCDISTGEFNLMEFVGVDYLQKLDNMLSTIEPSEILCNEEFLLNKLKIQYFLSKEIKPRANYEFAYDAKQSYEKFQNQLGVVSLECFECHNKDLAISASGGLLEYLNQMAKRALPQIVKLNLVKTNQFMILDSNTRRNLEIAERIRDGRKKGSLFGVLDKCQTGMGSRNLKKWLDTPLQDETKILQRQEAVQELIDNIPMREDIKDNLKCVSDLERLSGRVAFGSVSPRDCLSIANTLNQLPNLKNILSKSNAKFLQNLDKNINPLVEIADLLFGAISENAPANTKDGGYLKDTFSSELLELRNIKNESKNWISTIEQNEREATGIKNLKIGYNRVFGYYIEISKTFSSDVPYRYLRKQTLTNSERFTTEQLKEVEEKVLSSTENSLKLEESLFEGIKEVLQKYIGEFQVISKSLAELDSILSFAIVSQQNRYTRPVVSKKLESISIEDGRHPVVETLTINNSYIANDTKLDSKDCRTMIITGPNMAGKSTYMRQVALIAFMAHIGCFVPAKNAEMMLVDRIFTRIGASDDLGAGQSTFMVEMVEVATILNNATNKSLLVLDEIGRGTSTIDGLSIAWAVMEDINKNIGALTLFATHFHELANLEDLDGVKNYRIMVKEKGNEILFLHKIVRGGANKSFGIEVASLAGVPKKVVQRSKQVMLELENMSNLADGNDLLKVASKYNSEPIESIEIEEKIDSKDEIREQLNCVDINNCTPIQALNILMELTKLAKE